MAQRVKKLFRLIARAPLTSFLVLLALLFAVIFLGGKMRAPDIAEEQEGDAGVKKVHIMSAKGALYAEASGEIKRDDIVTITATTNGIVYRINTEVGAAVRAGKSLVTLSETYGGGNTASATQRLADRSVQNQNETFDKNLGIADDLRDDVGGGSVSAEIARKQQTIAKRNLEFQRDVVALERQQATQSAARFYPTAPITGVVERIFVRPGQTVVAGEPLMVVRGDDSSAEITVTMSAATARAVSVEQPSRIMRDDGTFIEALPTHISAVPTDERSFSMTFYLEEDLDGLIDGDFISAQLPLVGNDEHILVPLDAVQVTNDGAVLFVAKEGIAHSRMVTLGDVVGAHVFVVDGISNEDTVIVERTVFDGDNITIINE